MSDDAPAVPSPVAGPDDLRALRHDLRTPLNQIIGYTEMLIEGAEDQDTGVMLGDLRRIHQAARHLHHLIDEHLAPGRLRLAGSATTAPATGPAARLATGATSRSTRAIPPGEGRVLVVDDNEMNRDMLSRRLQRQGYAVSTAVDGLEALELVRARPFDLVLLDIMMPGLDGHGVLASLKADAELRHLPVIMISALDELESVVRCIEAGAEDYLTKPFEPTLLRARVGATLEKKRLRDQEQETHRALVESQRRLAAELSKAASYVRSLLPTPLDGPVQSEWRFIPSMQLGGDSFGHHWLDDHRLALYLLDVCGHGVGTALLSISIINVLRSQSLPGTDFGDPGAVLSALNERFPMESQHNMHFTAWYGVYDRALDRIAFASGGHPPAVLLAPGAETPQVDELCTPNFMIGALPGVAYHTESRPVPRGSTLFVFSDGVYEVCRPDGTWLEFSRFVQMLTPPGVSGGASLDDVVAAVRTFQQRDDFEDDVSIVRFAF